MTVLIAYRENPLFSKYIPLILPFIPQGVRINRMPFPADTPKEVLQQELGKMFQHITTDCLYVSDIACSGMYDGVGYIQGTNMVLPLHIRPTETLNRGLLKAVMRLHEEETFREAFCKVASTVMPKPKRIYLTRKDLGNDIHLRNFRNSEELKEKFGGRREPFIDYLVDTLKTHYGNIPVIVVHGLKYFSPDLESKDCLVISAEKFGLYDSWENPAKLMSLPLANSIEHLIHNGILHKELEPEALFKEFTLLAKLALQGHN